MNKQELIDSVTSLVADVLELPDVSTLRKAQRDEIVEWDSLGHLRIFMAIENKYSVKIPIEEMFSVTNLEDIIENISQKLVDQGKNT